VLESVRYVYLAQSDHPQQGPPKLEGLALNGQWAVLYSPLSLSNGWEQMEFAYNQGYTDLDALRMGINLLLYALTH